MHDERLWTADREGDRARRGNSTALVGSYEQVAEALLGYVAIGVTTLLIRGYTPRPTRADYATLIRLVREQADPAALVSAR